MRSSASLRGRDCTTVPAKVSFTGNSPLLGIVAWRGFCILHGHARFCLGFVDVKQLREAIDHFICAYNAQTAPFEWRQDEIKQQPMRDNISYFCR
jgi:hypothetical protein